MSTYLPNLFHLIYITALYSGKASTNLHIDMSDAVNCLVYVGFPKDGNMEENAKQVLREVDKAGQLRQGKNFGATP